MNEEPNILRSDHDDIGKKLDAAIKRLAELEEKFKTIPSPREMGFNIPIHSFTHDKHFRSQLDRGNLTLLLNTDQLKRDMSTTTGGGGGGGVQGSSYEQTYVNSIGCIADVSDPNCGIPFDVTFRDRITLGADGILVRELQNAFAQFHVQCKFIKCSSSSSDGGSLDRWRPCGNEDDSEDIFLDPAIFEMLPAEMEEPIILIDSQDRCFFFVESGVTGEVETDPAPFIYIYDGCDSVECPYDPCDATCAVPQNDTTAAINSAALPLGCASTWDAQFGDGPYVYSAGGGVTDWQWWYAPPAMGAAVFEMRCTGGVMEARLVSRGGTSIFGDTANGPTYWKNVTASVSCNGNGKLTGSFSLSILNALFCGGGAPGSSDTVTVTLA